MPSITIYITDDIFDLVRDDKRVVNVLLKKYKSEIPKLMKEIEKE